MYRETRKGRIEVAKQHKSVSAAMYNGKEKKYLGSVDIICNEPVSGNRFLVSKTASYVADPETYVYKLSFSYACTLISAVIPEFQMELSEQKSQRIYSNDYKIHLMRLIDTLIANSNEKAKNKNIELTKLEQFASALKTNPFNNLDFITVRFNNSIIRPLTAEDITTR